MTFSFRWHWHLTLFFNNFYHFALKFWISVITLSLANWFTSYSHTMLQWWYRSWPSDDLDIQRCSLTICVKVLFFNYNLFISWQIYFILTHNVALHWYATLWPSNQKQLCYLKCSICCNVLFQSSCDRWWEILQKDALVYKTSLPWNCQPKALSGTQSPWHLDWISMVTWCHVHLWTWHWD